MSVYDKKCKTCIFSEWISEKEGRCHRFPPQFAILECGYFTSKYYKFPKINKYDWCGEYRNG